MFLIFAALALAAEPANDAHSCNVVADWGSFKVTVADLRKMSRALDRLEGKTVAHTYSLVPNKTGDDVERTIALRSDGTLLMVTRSGYVTVDPMAAVAQVPSDYLVRTEETLVVSPKGGVTNAFRNLTPEDAVHAAWTESVPLDASACTQRAYWMLGMVEGVLHSHF